MGSSGRSPASKVDLGLDNVDNTSDPNKPISTATAAALAAKATLTGYTMERVFSCAFSGGTANQKIDLYFTGTIFAAFEITLVGLWSGQNATGVIKAVYSLSGSNTGTVYENNRTTLVAQGTLPESFGLTGASWDATNSRWKITLVHRTSTANSVSMQVRWQGNSTAYSDQIRDSIGVSAAYTTDVSTVPVASVTTGSVALGIYVPTDPQWGYTSGTDIGPAANTAISAMPTAGGVTVGGHLVIPAGAWTTSERIILKPGVRVSGVSKAATKITGTAAGVFGWTSTLFDFAIENIDLQSNVGHLMTNVGADYGIYRGTIRNVRMFVNDITKSIMYHDSALDYDKVMVEDCEIYRNTSATVPMWYVRNSGGAANENTFRGLWVDSNQCNSSYAIHFESTAPASWAYENKFEDITGERNCGGLLKLLNHYQLTLDNVSEWDATTNYAADIVHIGKSPATSLKSQFVTIRGYGRRVGTLNGGVYDINLVPGQVSEVTISLPNKSPGVPSINFDSADGVTITGAPDGIWATQPTGVSHYFGKTIQPEGGILGVARRGNLLGTRVLLSGSPCAMVVNTITMPKDTWYYMPLTVEKPIPVGYLGTIFTTPASGGTAALRFALHRVDANNRPAARQADYSSYGTIDLTTGAGSEAFVATAGLIIPAGNWTIGCAWSGTATVSPVIYALSGVHPSVTGNTITTQSNAYSQSVSGASAPATAVPAATAVQGVAVYAVMA